MLCNNRCLGWGRAMLGSTMDTCFASSRVAFGRIYDFLHDGVASAAELDSRPALLPTGRHIVDNGSGMFHIGFAGIDAPRAVFP